MKVMALKQLQQANQSLYDPIAIDTAALQAIGWSNPMQFMAPASVQGQPPPELIAEQAKIAATTKTADAKMLEAQSKAANDAKRIAMDQQKTQAGVQLDAEKIQMDKIETVQRAKTEDDKNQRDAQNRVFDERMNLVDAAQNIADHPESAGLVAPLLRPAIDDLKKQDGGGKQPGLVPGNGNVQ